MKTKHQAILLLAMTTVIAFVQIAKSIQYTNSLLTRLMTTDIPITPDSQKTYEESSPEHLDDTEKGGHDNNENTDSAPKKRYHHNIYLDVNPECTIAQDIINITHIPQKFEVVIELKPGQERKCIKPQLIGRLSGPALSRLTWEKQVQKQGAGQSSTAESDQSHSIIGHYSVPEAGRYFLEIIVTYCQEFDYETNVRDICLEDPLNHRLTHKNASIDISQPNISDTVVNHVELHDGQNETLIGYWYNTLEEMQHEPLYTRYQPQNCRKDDAETSRCKVATDLSRFDPYEFRFNNQQISTSMIKGALQERQEIVCFVGASHSKLMFKKAHQLIQKLNLQGNIQVKLFTSKFIADVKEETVQHLIALKCTKVVFSTGQWDAGYPHKKPTSFQAYEQMLSQALRHFEKGKEHFDLYFRQAHYNSLGDSITKCRPKDWRGPQVIDMYNQINSRKCKEFGVPFINTNNIMGVTWDRAPDWCHYKDVSSDLETLYVFHTMFST